MAQKPSAIKQCQLSVVNQSITQSSNVRDHAAEAFGHQTMPALCRESV